MDDNNYQRQCHFSVFKLDHCNKVRPSFLIWRKRTANSAFSKISQSFFFLPLLFRSASSKTYYDILGVNKTSTTQDIKDAFVRLSKEVITDFLKRCIDNWVTCCSCKQCDVTSLMTSTDGQIGFSGKYLGPFCCHSQILECPIARLCGMWRRQQQQ